MTLHFVGLDPENPGGNCPAVFVDEETGDFLFEGTTLTDPELLEKINKQSPILPHESVVRLPARMREIILEACGERALVR